MERHCRRCDTSQPPSEFYEGNSWCKTCYRTWYQSRSGGIVNRSCDWCGQVLQVTGRRAAEKSVFCSRPCKDKKRHQQASEALLQSKPARRCIHCTTPLAAAKRADAVFCTVKCQEAAVNLVRKINRRSAIYGTKPLTDKYVDRAAIIERDCSVCQVCSAPVDATLQHPDPMAPSIDHKIPLARGGGNELDNLQLTHLRCNLQKRNRV